MQERQHGVEQAVRVSQCVSECENEPVGERLSVFGCVLGPECRFACVCERAAHAWLGAAEMEGRLPLDGYNGARPCSGTAALQHYRGVSVQKDGSPDVKQVDTVRAADSRLSKSALKEVVAGWESGWALPVSGPVEEVELAAAALEKASAAVAGIAQQTEA